MRFVLVLDLATAGNNREAMMPMMLMATSTSTNVKPAWRDRVGRLESGKTNLMTMKQPNIGLQIFKGTRTNNAERIL